MMRLRLFILTFLAVVSMASCKSQYELMLNSNDADAKYEAAFAYFNEGKYSKAAALFESLSVLTNGTERDDTVRYYWGLSNYRYRDFYTAETNFTQFIEAYPRSPFTSDARYLRIDCLYRSTLRYELDQTPTYTALNAISEYILEFPDTEHMQECRDMMTDLNERLDRKAYEAAKLYYHMENYNASRVALRNVLKDDAETVYREDVLYYIAMSSYNYARLSVPEKQKERYLVFMDDYLNFVSEIPQSNYKKELDAVYRKAQKAIGKEVVETDEDTADMSARDFAKERKRLMREAKKAQKEQASESAE